MSDLAALLANAASRAARYRQQVAKRSPLPTASLSELRAALCRPLGEEGRLASEVIAELADAAEPGFAGTTSPAFHGWVIGGSHPAGVAAEMLTAAWGQNAVLYQSAPAAAVVEEAAAGWLLDLLDMPRESSVGFATGATMASFIGLTAARIAMLERAGWDLEQDGLFGAPEVTVFLGAEAHSTIFHALRLLGFGRRRLVTVEADGEGRMMPGALARAMARRSGPAIVIAQAGHINSGAFDDITAIAATAQARGAWLHVDGAFGMWARASRTRRHLAKGMHLADSCSLDGHKWLQVPYDCGYAILRNADMHRRAMSISASYLNREAEGGRNPSDYVPELSRRARGFASWAVMRALGRKGIADIIEDSCDNARIFAVLCAMEPSIRVMNDVQLNQVCIAPRNRANEDAIVARVSQALADDGRYFVKPAEWQGRPVLRFSFCGQPATHVQVEAMAALVACAFAKADPMADGSRMAA
ncbi:pyridoxal phosphate-dependent decarboxylase family protein [Croceicoccus mobilis]|uniref:Aspartate aminotransferase family protein n=1 Tax=Croceicoccus mobilis TaxID=1703339 RepID=A0A916Z0C6_9SPHN|nr:pyridoxal-dependent decarboxylase [Croceicoccus mobilis]GGD69944.1 aspartate aminotransferase family protein [Croceicoccus mobilis]